MKGMTLAKIADEHAYSKSVISLYLTGKASVCTLQEYFKRFCEENHIEFKTKRWP